jgi:hypothetical protein
VSFESIRDRWANWPVPSRILIALVVVGGVGYGVVKPGYGVFKSWRLSRNLVEAGRAVEAAEMSKARDLSLTVLSSGDKSIAPLRILEKSTAALGDPRHSEIAKMLLTHSAATDDDRWNGFRGIVNVVPLGIVAQAWATLPAACRLQSRFAVAFAERVIPENRLAEATTVLLAVPDQDRSEELHRMVIRVLIKSGKNEGLDEAQRRIATGWQAAGEDRSPWLDLLEELPPLELRNDLLAPVRRTLTTSPSAENVREQLMLARLDHAAAEEGKRLEIVERAAATWKGHAPAVVAKFLTDLGSYQLIPGAFPTAAVGADLNLQRLVIAAMAITEKWADLLELLNATGQTLAKFEESAYRSLVAANTGDAAGKARHWSDAVGEAKSAGAPDALLRIERIARRFGMAAEADQAMLDAIKSGRGPLPLFADLSPLTTALEAQERESVLMEIYAIYLPFEPGNPELITRYAYLACLNRLVEPQELVARLESLSTSFPKEAMLQWVLATVYLCDGKPEQAATVFERLGDLKLEDRVPGFRISYLTTEVLNRRMMADDPQIKDFPWNTLKVSERKRFTELIQAFTP